ncbi:MAG: lysophospholipid acyltransferase family protein [Chloroflexota bacterium]
MADRARSKLPGPAISPIRRTLRYWISRMAVSIVCRAYVRVHIEDRERLPSGPAIYCFNHLSWADPFVLMAVLPFRPRLWFFGPKEEDMAVGGRNQLMYWTGTAIPYKPGKNDLLDATRRVAAVIDSGSVVAIAGEGRIHVRESELLPLSEGAAYFALRSGVPLVPIAINGTSWLRFGGRVRIRVAEPVSIAGRPTREAITKATTALTASLAALLADAPDLEEPGRIGRWVTERFNDWPEGSRDAARAASEAARLPYFDPSE